MKKWKELEQGDLIYALIPIINNDNNFLSYELQKINIIHIKEKESSLQIRFKYTDGYGKRKRIETVIPSFRLNYRILAIDLNSKYFCNDQIKFGNIILSLNLDDINLAHKNILLKKINDLNTEINYKQEYIKFLHEQSYGY